MTPDEVMRKWELPYDHPESWVQEDRTYRMIWQRARNDAYEEAAKIADSHAVWPGYSRSEASVGSAIADAIRAEKETS